ncbi:MAG: S8 family peptidase [Acidobacteria bacterium]|nr:S8 family peptidase [Acidobacteriota bacterium]
MTVTVIHSMRPAQRPRFSVILAFLGALALSVPAQAGPHRARLSGDLAERLAQGRDEPTSVIVSGSRHEIEALAARHGARLKKLLRDGAVLEVTGGQLDALSQDADVDHLSGDVPVHRMMSVTTAAVGADQVWIGQAGEPKGLTGHGIGVAVIDSGVGPHSALRSRIVASFDFTKSRGVGVDKYGHGTHVAGIIAGSDEGGYAGVAPGAHIVSLRVLAADGSGETSDVIAAIDWAIENRAAYNLRILNLSLGHPVYESSRDDPLCQAVERATRAGLVVVAAAGNRGKTEDGRPVAGGIDSPANAASALTVGASNTRGTPQRSDDVMTTYSSRGPTLFDGLLKPEVAAPGNRIVAPAAPGSYLTRTYPERVVSGHGAHAYIELSGTSMAAAVVSGVTALLLESRVGKCSRTCRHPRLGKYGRR